MDVRALQFPEALATLIEDDASDGELAPTSHAKGEREHERAAMQAHAAADRRNRHKQHVRTLGYETSAANANET